MTRPLIDEVYRLPEPWKARAAVLSTGPIGTLYCVVLGLNGEARGRVLRIRRDRLVHLVRPGLAAWTRVPCPCRARGCTGTVEWRDARRIYARMR